MKYFNETVLITTAYNKTKLNEFSSTKHNKSSKQHYRISNWNQRETSFSLFVVWPSQQLKKHHQIRNLRTQDMNRLL